MAERRRAWPRLLLGLGARTDRTALIASLVLGLVSSLLGPLFAPLFGALVDAALDGRTSAAAALAAAIAVALSVGRACQSYASMLAWNLWERATVTLDRDLVELTTRLGLVDRLERPEFLDRLTLVRTNREHFQESTMALLGAVFLALQVAVTVIILAFVAPVLLVLPLFSAAPIAAARWAEGRSQRALRDSAADVRTADALALLAVESASAGELRVLRLGQLVRERHASGWERALEQQWRADVVGTAVSAAALTLFTLAFAASVLYVTIQSVNGSASLGAVVIVLTAGQQLHHQIGGVLSNAGALFRIRETMRHLAWLQAYVARHEERGELAPPRALGQGIALEGVSFRYEGASRNALEDLSLALPAGAVVAVVGENGAGKSTLVSLLCGLHRPLAGRVLVDGVDLTRLDARAWRASASGAFQEFVRFELLARESIGVGQVIHVDDPARARAALGRADAADLEHELPEQLDTPLGRAFLPGVDLSGGQWQKIALARSAMREVPLLVVLDEPTYSLDVESERRVFEWFSRVAAERSPAGAITVIVSHRFSSVRAADVVAVLHEGRLVEYGSHAELVASGGRYAAMYRTQAAGYG